MLEASDSSRPHFGMYPLILAIAVYGMQTAFAQGTPDRDEVIAPRPELRISAYLTANTVKRKKPCF